MNKPEKKFIKRVIPLVVDVLVLVGFYISLRVYRSEEFIDERILPFTPLLSLLVLFVFFTLFYYLLMTSDEQRQHVAAVWAKGMEIKSRVLRILVRLAVGTAIFVYAFVHFIFYFAMLVMGSWLNGQGESAVAVVMARPTVYIMMFSIIVFAILFTYLGGDPDTPPETLEKRRVKLKASLPISPLKHAWQFGLSSMILPVFALWIYLAYVVPIPYISAADPSEQKRARLFGWMELLFGLLLLILLHVEVSLRAVDSPQEAIQRATILFFLLYLPLKLMIILVNKYRLSLWFELLWAMLFFVAQLMILYSVTALSS